MKSSVFLDITPCSPVKISGRFRVKFLLFPACFVLVPWLAYSSAVKMVAACPSETSDDFHRTARRHIPEDRILYNKLIVQSETPNLFLAEGYFLSKR
jgi:hypothetical protein